MKPKMFQGWHGIIGGIMSLGLGLLIIYPYNWHDTSFVTAFSLVIVISVMLLTIGLSTLKNKTKEEKK